MFVLDLVFVLICVKEGRQTNLHILLGLAVMTMVNALGSDNSNDSGDGLC